MNLKNLQSIEVSSLTKDATLIFFFAGVIYTKVIIACLDGVNNSPVYKEENK